MKKQVADYRQQNLVMKQELRKRKVIKDLSDFESFIPKAVRDELVNNDIWNTAGETQQIIQGVAPAVQAPVARQLAPTQSPTPLDAGETPPLGEIEGDFYEEVEPLLPQVVSVNKATEDMEKVEGIIRNVEDTIAGRTTKQLRQRYNDIQVLANERGLTDNSKVFLANIEAIHLEELDKRGVLEGVREVIPSKSVKEGAKKKAEEMIEEQKPISLGLEFAKSQKANQPKKRGRPPGSKNKDPPKDKDPKDPTQRGRKTGSTDTTPRKRRTKAEMEQARKQAGKGMKRRGRPKGSKNKKRMNLLIGSAVAGNDNNELLKIISQK
jgi:hypothetical protein